MGMRLKRILKKGMGKMSSDPQQSPQEPFIPEDQRPDLTIDMNQRVGDLTVRDLASILGSGATQQPKLKEITLDKAPIKDAAKEIFKENKDRKDAKEHKEPKDHKDQKDTKDHKDPKEHKDQKDLKDHKELKEGLIEKPPQKEVFEKITDQGTIDPGGPVEQQTTLQDIVQRLSGLEADLQQVKTQMGAQPGG